MTTLLILLLQLMLIIGAAQVAGWLFQRLGQPRVVGEMAVGILLGPSILGRLVPELALTILNPALSSGLIGLSQLGLILFLFLIGLELNPGLLRQQGTSIIAISLASMGIPLALGITLAAVLYSKLGSAQMPIEHFALFLGIALSVTAFPVLARILGERKLLHTPIGTLTIVCAAVNELLTWVLLAGAVLLIRSTTSGLPLSVMLAGCALYISGMLTLGRAAARRLLAPTATSTLTQLQFVGIVLGILASAAITEWLGLHALIGAFLAGAILPRDRALLRQIESRLADITTIVLLPLFFATVGLRTDIGAITDAAGWQAAGLMLVVAIAGKLGGTALAARSSGMPWRTSLGLGALMNTRGIMALVIASIGLEIGAISPQVFTILALVAMITTLMTGPLLSILKIGPEAPHPVIPVAIPENL